MAITLGFRIVPSNPEHPLSISVRINGQNLLVLDQVISNYDFSYLINDDAASHMLSVVLSNKTHKHTQIDADDNIVSDSLINLDNFTLDGIEISNTVFQQAQYWNDRNGTAESRAEPFYGSMGCNGTVRFEFTTPGYLWLLANI